MVGHNCSVWWSRTAGVVKVEVRCRCGWQGWALSYDEASLLITAHREEQQLLLDLEREDARDAQRA